MKERFLGSGDRVALPTGTVTYLFTDIEGSTALLRQLGDSYAALLEAHHRIIRYAISTGEGTEVDTTGDGFFALFPAAMGALNAAVAARLWGAADRVYTNLHGEGAPIDHRSSKELRDRLSLSMDANDLDREISAGEALNLDEAVRLAEISLFPVVTPV